MWGFLNLRVIGVDRAPSFSNGNDYLLVKAICELVSGEALRVLVGDFSYIDISWKEFTGKTGTSTMIVDVPVQLVRQPTRGRSILDLALTNNDPLLKKSTKFKSTIRSSDHPVVEFNVHLDLTRWTLNVSNSSPHVSRQFNKADHNAIAVYL